MAIRTIGKKFQVDIFKGGKRYRVSADSYSEAQSKEMEIKLEIGRAHV
jgi:hypothetical protein